jgi:hypothetical protein
VGQACALLASKAPPASTGLLLLSTVQDLPGSDPFGVGLSLHVAFVPWAAVAAADLTSDAFGAASYTIPIPNDPGLAGFTAYFQAVWLWPSAACPLPPYQLSASNGLAFTIQ